MPELSTLLRQRLRAAEDRASQHPDPDVLTAYVEELLPVPERDVVLKHLSLCSGCREIVALTMPDAAAAPEFQVETVPAVSRPARRWFRSPVFGFAGSIAAVVLGVALILRLPPHANQTVATNSTGLVQQAKTPAAPPSVTTDGLISRNGESATVGSLSPQLQPELTAPLQAKPESTRTAAGLRGAAPVRRATAVGEKESAAVPVFTAELRKEDYVNKMFLASSSESAAAAPAFGELPQAPVPVQPSTFFAPAPVIAGNGYSVAFEVSSKAAGRNQTVVRFQSGEPQGNRSTSLLDKIVDLGKRPLGRRPGAPISSSSVETSAMFRPGMAAAQSADAMAAKSSEQAEGGVLARSKAFSSNALATLPRRQMLGAPQYQWKVVQGKLLRSGDNSHWTEENPNGDAVQFFVVSVNGPEVWAGGDQAALLHSRDAGTTWERITLGAAAAGTINTIEAAGQTVRVKSSSGQSWVSQDGGRSWVLQD